MNYHKDQLKKILPILPLLLLTAMAASTTQLITRNSTDFRTAPKAATSEDSTGAVAPTLTPDENSVLQKYASLYNLCPITGNGFNIQRNDAESKFTVFLQAPFDTAKTNFDTWISKNNYGTLPSSMFEIIADSLAPTMAPTPIPTQVPIIPNCSNISGPSSLTIGQSGTYSAKVFSPGSYLAGEINTYNGTISRIAYQTLTPPNATISGTWTPTAAGSFSICCRAWNDSIAECRPSNFTGVSPPVYACAGPNTCITVNVVAPTSTPTLLNQGTGLKGDYYNGTNFDSFISFRTDSGINFNWGTGSPMASVGADNFSVRWTGQIEAPYTGTYTFSTYSDDGVKLTVNGTQVINNWTGHSPTTNTGTISLIAGQRYPLTLEYFENGGGSNISLSWSYANTNQQIIPSSRLYPTIVPTPVSALGTGLSGNYFNGTEFNSLIGSRKDSGINFNWDTGSPMASVGADNFSVRWTGQIEAPYAGNYQFSTVSDDGVKLTVNGTQVINNWTGHSPTTNTGTISLIAGQRYPLTLEYFENGGGALIQLFWTLPGLISPQIIPGNRLY